MPCLWRSHNVEESILVARSKVSTMCPVCTVCQSALPASKPTASPRTFPGRACRTADPSAALGMTKGRATLPLGFVAGGENRRSPFDFAQGRLSTSLCSGRDDNSYLGKGCECPRKIGIAEKSQTLGDDKGEGDASMWHPVAGGENSRSPFDFAQGRLSTSPRSGRDDNSCLGAGCECPRKSSSR